MPPHHPILFQTHVDNLKLAPLHRLSFPSPLVSNSPSFLLEPVAAPWCLLCLQPCSHLSQDIAVITPSCSHTAFCDSLNAYKNPTVPIQDNSSFIVKAPAHSSSSSLKNLSFHASFALCFALCTHLHQETAPLPSPLWFRGNEDAPKLVFPWLSGHLGSWCRATACTAEHGGDSPPGHPTAHTVSFQPGAGFSMGHLRLSSTAISKTETVPRP